MLNGKCWDLSITSNDVRDVIVMSTPLTCFSGFWFWFFCSLNRSPLRIAHFWYDFSVPVNKVGKSCAYMCYAFLSIYWFVEWSINVNDVCFTKFSIISVFLFLLFSFIFSFFFYVSQTCWPGVCHIEGWLCCWYVAARCCTYSLYRMPFVQIVSVHRIRSFCFRNWWMMDIMHNTTEFIFVIFIFLRTGRSYKTGNCMYIRRRVSHWRNLCYNWLTRYDYSPKKNILYSLEVLCILSGE